MTDQISFHDIAYHNVLRDILYNGVRKADRTGTGTLSLFGVHMSFDLSDGSIPLLTSKRMHTKSIIHELLWFISGNTNNKILNEKGVTIWDEWAKEDGSLGPIYGKQWRAWQCNNGQTIDQLAIAIDTLKTNPDSRRILVNAWNVGELDDMALPPCHYSFQFNSHLASDRHLSNWKEFSGDTARERVLHCMLNMRSNDFFLGNPFNIAQYAILLRMVAEVTNMIPGRLIFSGADVHLYLNHLEQASIQLSRKIHPSPKLKFARQVSSIDDFKYEDVLILDYVSEAPIKAQVSV